MSSNFVIEEWRDLWTYKGDFIIVCFVYVFSWSTVLALPKLFIENGGGSFGVAYLASLLVCAIALVMVELAVGQLCASSAPKAMFNISPLFAGVGISQTLFSMIRASVLVAYSGYLICLLVHLFMSVDSGQLKWLSCSDEVAVETWTLQERNTTIDSNTTLTIKEYFKHRILNVSGGIEQTGDLQWMLISSSACVWVLVFMAVFMGVRWLGKVCYFTFIIPLLLALTLLVKSLSSDGASTMVYKVFETDWNALYKIETWMRALSQSMYGVGLGYGAYITLGSFNRRSNNFVGDTFLIIFIHLLTSCLGMVFIAALLGHLMGTCDLASEQVLVEGFPQIFSLMEAVGHFEHPHLWSALLLIFFLFLMLNCLYVLVLNIQTPVEDSFGDSASSLLARTAICLSVCTVGFVITLGYNAQSGFLVTQLIEKYLDFICPWFIIALEIVAIGWFYCAHILALDVGQMITNRCSKIFAYPFIEFGYLLAAAPIYVMVIKLMNYSQQADGQRSAWKEIIGWTLAVFILLPIPINMVYTIVRTCVKGPGFSAWEKFKYSFASPMRYEIPKVASAPRYTSTAPGYVLLPHAPLAEPEQYSDMYSDRQVTRISKA